MRGEGRGGGCSPLRRKWDVEQDVNNFVLLGGEYVKHLPHIRRFYNCDIFSKNSEKLEILGKDGGAQCDHVTPLTRGLSL